MKLYGFGYLNVVGCMCMDVWPLNVVRSCSVHCDEMGP